MVLFIVIMCLWAFYLMLYFSMSMWSRYLPVVTEKVRAFVWRCSSRPAHLAATGVAAAGPADAGVAPR